ncbi:hypothetical protein MD273_07085 [Marinobacter pelagius]|uniref:hypothetical protein n=1 Tax=Marinobacter sp. C7 TaxID=2951363 RepID=UPI001EF06BAF|nr:hypothetical protein [Marinobacter sp. C7]MCG7199484.1 hypothetical protein [Marinobacter sp. C7]
MKLAKRLSFLVEVYRLHGFAEMCSVAWSGFLHKGTKRLILVALSRPRPIPKALEASEGHDFHFATPEELRSLMKQPSFEIAPVDIERVEKDVARCLVQMDGDKLTGYAWVWVSKVAYIDDGVYLNLPRDAIYNYKAYTDPEYRGLGFQGLRHLHLLRLLEGEGIKRLFGFVDHLNTKSLHGVRKSGYEKVGELKIRHKDGEVSSHLVMAKDFWPGRPAD